MQKRSLLMLCWACSLLASLPWPVSAYAAPTSYAITAQELTQLSDSLTQLQQANEISQKDLATLKTQLRSSQEQLQQAEEQSVQLNAQLTSLKARSAQVESLLEVANQSLVQYKHEEAAKLSNAKRQRNIWLGIAGGLLIYCVLK